MSDPEPHPLHEGDFAKMVQGALDAHGIERHIRGILETAAGTNGRSGLISLPNGPPVRVNVPSAQELGLMALNAALVQLQTVRIILVALNDIDSRLRTQAGTPRPLDTQGHPATGKVGDERGSQSPEAASYQEATSQGYKPSRPTVMVDGNPSGKAKG